MVWGTNVNRNSEFKVCITVEIIVTILAAVLAKLCPDIAVWIVIATGIVMIITYYIGTSYRYMKIKNLSDYLRKVQNGDCTYDFSGYSEGELSILQSEILKVTSILTEQKEALIKDKRYLSDAISDISHQLKTPLTSMNIMVELLNDTSLPSDKREEFTGQVLRQLNRIEWLVSSMLKMSKLDAGTIRLVPEATNVKRLINTSIEHLLISMELRGINCEIKCDDNDAVIVDAKWTSEALSNIIKNCIEHMSEGGNLNISFEHGVICDVITIADNGCGIDKGDLPNIFKRFYRGKNADKDSVGIGLAFANQIISMEGGRITVQSEVSVGTTFEIKLYNMKNI